jgi:hypothetical protein
MTCILIDLRDILSLFYEKNQAYSSLCKKLEQNLKSDRFSLNARLGRDFLSFVITWAFFSQLSAFLFKFEEKS